MDGIEFHVNGKRVGVAVDPDTPLLYVLRNDLGLKGTRAGCVEGQCMSCTVLVDGRAVTACMEPVGAVAGRKVETVESLVNGETRRLGPGSVVFQAANQLHGLRNVGDTPATYFVIRWNSPGMLKARTDAR